MLIFSFKNQDFFCDIHGFSNMNDMYLYFDYFHRQDYFDNTT